MIFHTVQQQDIYFSVHLQLSRARTASSAGADKVIVAPWRHLINGVGIRPASVSAALEEDMAIAKPQLVAVACCVSRRYDTWPKELAKSEN